MDFVLQKSNYERYGFIGLFIYETITLVGQVGIKQLSLLPLSVVSSIQ